MLKRVLIGLCTIGVFVVLGGEANAGCASIGGVWQCASWIKGSTEGETNSHSGEAIKCTPPDCPTVTFRVRGTIGVGEPGCDFEGDVACGIQGVLVCLQKKCTDPDLTQCLNSAKTFGHTHEGELSFEDQVTDCKKKVCNTFKNSARFGDQLDAEDCPQGNPVSEFTVTEAIFVTEFCPFGHGATGECCGSLLRDSDGNCISGDLFNEGDPVTTCYRGKLTAPPLPADGTPYVLEELSTESQTYVNLGCSPYGK